MGWLRSSSKSKGAQDAQFLTGRNLSLVSCDKRSRQDQITVKAALPGISTSSNRTEKALYGCFDDLMVCYIIFKLRKKARDK